MFDDCDDGHIRQLGGRRAIAPSAGRCGTSQSPGQIDEIWILNVNGELNVIDVLYCEGTPAEPSTRCAPSSSR